MVSPGDSFISMKENCVCCYRLFTGERLRDREAEAREADAGSASLAAETSAEALGQYLRI